jgi:hypothetical protein
LRGKKKNPLLLLLGPLLLCKTLAKICHQNKTQGFEVDEKCVENITFIFKEVLLCHRVHEPDI